MRKLFLLIPALVLSLFTNAAVINIDTETSDALRKALNSANDGDEIVMAAGTYVESNSNYIAFNAKSVTVKAADGATVIIKPHVPFTVSGGARAEIRGVKIDASELCSLSSYSHLMYASDNAANNRLILDGCEIYGYTVGKAVIAARSSYKLDSLIINNCKFYNHTTRSCVFLENTENKGLIITNSTFYEIATGTEDFGAGVIDDRSTTAKVRVDHCTFYNVQAKSTDFAAIGKIKTSDAIVSNSIFMMPTSTGSLRAIRDVAQANNCLTYNYTYDSNWGIHGDVTKSNCIQLEDPLFTNAASRDFHITDASPAYLVGSDNKSLGAKCWWPAAPETDFATSYNLVGSKAGLTGNIRLNANSNIEYFDKSEAGTAVWELNVTRTCAIQAVIDLETGSASGCIFQIKAYNEAGEEVGTITAPYKEDDEDISVPGTLYLPEAGIYTLKLFNNESWSSAKVEKIILSYVGGAVIPVSPSVNTTLNVADAWFSGCTRDNEKTYIQYPSSETSSAWIKWNIATTETKYYDLTLNINAPNAHGLIVAIYEDEAAAPIESVTEGSYVSSTGDLALELGRVNLVGGKNYVVKVTNSPSGSVAKIINLVFAPVVATVTAFPATLNFNDAVLSARAHVTDGKLYFAPIGDTNPVGEWASWSVTTDHDGLFLFTMGVNSDNEQSYKITILDDGDNMVDFCDLKTSTGAQTLKHYFQLATGNYSVKVENTYAWSHGHLTSFIVTEPGTVITISEEATDNSAWSAKVDDGNNYDVQIIRTLRAGMYNTFCLPFAVSSNEAKEIFGLDIEIYTLETAVVTDNVLYVTLKENSDIYQGTPVFIKPSRDIVNPIFDGVEFTIAAPSGTTGTNANFVGTFVKTSLEPDQNILYLGTDNTLYYPEVSTPIKGMRGWFVIHDAPTPAPGIRQMCIVEKTDTPTNITFVEDNGNKARKMITNGQLIIIRDGVRYNAMGTRIE